jgi:chaperonin GroEL (HSP60 family)
MGMVDSRDRTDSILSSQVDNIPTEQLIEDVEALETQAEQDPEAVISELPQLLELLESTGFGEQEVYLRDVILSVTWLIAENNPQALGDYYPEFVEATLDTTESQVLVRGLLHQIVELVARDVSLTQIYNGLDRVGNKVPSMLEEMTDALSTDGHVPGNGATAMALTMNTHDFAAEVGGRKQLVVEAYATALEDLVMLRAGEHGFDPIDGFVDLKTQYESRSAPFTLGFSDEQNIVDMIEADVTWTPISMLRHIVDSIVGAMLILAVEESEDRILRAEAVIAEQLQ